MADVFSAIAEDRRAAALAAIASVADPASVTGISPVTGGASRRLDAADRRWLGRRTCCGSRSTGDGFRNPRRSYPCLRAAAAAGIAPAVHHADEEAGVVLMDFVVERPLTAFPGGEPALLRTLGEMVARLQATAPFPAVMEDFGALVEAMLNLVRDGGLFAPGVLDGHVAGLARVRAEYPWAAAQVSAHNDINPRNVLFDGRAVVARRLGARVPQRPARRRRQHRQQLLRGAGRRHARPRGLAGPVARTTTPGTASR